MIFVTKKVTNFSQIKGGEKAVEPHIGQYLCYSTVLLGVVLVFRFSHGHVKL